MPTFHDVTLIFPHGDHPKTVINKLSLVLPEHTTTAIVGPSGCGKTTLLRLLAGLISPTLGNVTRETDSISFLFQEHALLPWLTAAQNVNLVLSDTAKTLPLAKEWLSRVGLEQEANVLPCRLSGGMKQRVALARALAVDADLLLLDEPFRGLDEAMHKQMLDLIAEVRQGKTTVLVTHDKKDLRIASHTITMGNGTPMISG